jgi:decaprenylphospho-beta-D-erythro-pentofuranosid-2-ulose 2-reductase
MRAGKPRTVLVMGATSEIAKHTLRAFAAEGAKLCLVGRNPAKLETLAADLKIRGAAQVVSLVRDLSAFERHAAIVQEAFSQMGPIDLVYIAHGYLGDQRKAEIDFNEAEEIIRVNFLSVVSLCTYLVPQLQAQKTGTLMVISSVAGERGRQSNFVYGSAKAALTAYLDGLRNRLYDAGIGVISLKVGLVDTPMTAGVKRGPLMANPEKVGSAIYRLSRCGNGNWYVPRYWALVMAIVRSIPDVIFRRLKL